MSAGLSGSGTGAALDAVLSSAPTVGEREAAVLPVNRRRVARSGISTARNLAGLLLALLLLAIVLLVAGALALLISVSLYGYGGLG